MHVLLVYLKNSPPHQKPLIAVLLLYYDLLVEPQKYSIYREQAVNSISVAFDASLNDEKVREKCCRSLFILAGHFSSTGKILTKNSILKEVGYHNDISEVKTPDHEEEGLLRDGTISLEEEEERMKEWMVNLLETMIGDGEKCRTLLKTMAEDIAAPLHSLSEVTWTAKQLHAIVSRKDL
ncbi:putative E3 ubiquitin-protein ligase LIN-1 isoform X1 [Senna tora]|uniref:Putative E3 ubiquitin-protein ligase LIN-1 isoform X1 n=1 Tax=Senna tora TaxID=362788 RepID=A0A834WZK8_9FABA|nr:putative E3 ubiquitin-protein ligase LIN-1 isoform X1 [Senna tora]